MNNTKGLIGWFCLSIFLSHIGIAPWDTIQNIVWYLAVLRVESAIFERYTYVGWVCIFCGKPQTGTMWQAFTATCNHTPHE